VASVYARFVCAMVCTRFFVWRRIGICRFRVRCLGVVEFDDNALE
jgi:hypothetical protein